MKLLVVEDDRLLNNTLCYNLSAAGYTVDAAMTKSAAVDFCEAQDYDLIVLDVNLPDGNGFDFCREIKELGKKTPWCLFMWGICLEDTEYLISYHILKKR